MKNDSKDTSSLIATSHRYESTVFLSLREIPDNMKQYSVYPVEKSIIVSKRVAVLQLYCHLTNLLSIVAWE